MFRKTSRGQRSKCFYEVSLFLLSWKLFILSPNQNVRYRQTAILFYSGRKITTLKSNNLLFKKGNQGFCAVFFYYTRVFVHVVKKVGHFEREGEFGLLYAVL